MQRRRASKEAWRELGYFPDAPSSKEVGTRYLETVDFEGVRYPFINGMNKRVAWYSNFELSNNRYVSLWSIIYYEGLT